MTRQKLILPSQSMPWGRWVQDNIDMTEAAVARETQDTGSAGSVFAGRADLIQRQIADIPSVAAIYQISLPPFQVSRTMNPNAVRYVYNSPPQTFNPPRPDEAYSYTMISNLDVEGVFFNFADSLLRVNGVDFSYRHENLKPGEETNAQLSIAGSGTLSLGQTVQAQLAIAAGQAGTVQFRSASLWCVFTGSIL